MTTKTLNDIRKTLLQQHAEIRAHIEETRAAAAKSPKEGADYERQRQCLGRLANSMRIHNTAEEEALRSILPTIDPWGPVRHDKMLNEHMAEHSELYAALIEAGTADDPTAAAACIVKLLDQMVAHMAHEEEEFLCAHLFTDETHNDGFGG